LVPTEDAAKLLALQWAGAADEQLFLRATRLTAAELYRAETATELLRSVGMDLLEAVRWLLANYRRPSAVEWESAISEYQEARTQAGISPAQVSNVAKAAARLAGHVGRKVIGDLTRAEVEGFLENLPADVSAYTYNGLLGDIRTFCRWAVGRGHLVSDPTDGLERRKVRAESLPATLTPAAVGALLRDLEATAPGWVPYAALCVFAGLRPGTREGEANRLDADLRAGKVLLHAGGVEVRGKAHGVRIVPWSMCGPLKAWLDAYPPKPGLWPLDSAPKAERAWEAIRARHGLSADVLRHTAISAMVYAPGSSFAQVAAAVGNSEAMIRRHYLGRWTAEATAELWALRPTPPG
jgi:integrase